jgi:hypothetical protein
MPRRSNQQDQSESPTDRVPAVNFYTADELRILQKRQLDKYHWDFSNERRFMEDLFCTRFNFLLIAYSLFVTAAAGASERILFISIAFAGALTCMLVALTIVRAYLKLDIIFKVLYRAFPDHPISIIDQETKRAGRRLFRVNRITAYWLPAFMVASLILGALARLYF